VNVVSSSGVISSSLSDSQDEGEAEAESAQERRRFGSVTSWRTVGL